MELQDSLQAYVMNRHALETNFWEEVKAIISEKVAEAEDKDQTLKELCHAVGHFCGKNDIDAKGNLFSIQWEISTRGPIFHVGA